MGQQQLLLVILVTILVGIATVVAINVFGSAAEEANRDAVQQDLLMAASGAQAVYARPTALGGAGQDFEDIDAGDIMRALNIPGTISNADSDAPIITNENGVYTLDVSESNELLIDAEPVSWPQDIQLIVCRSTEDVGGDPVNEWRFDINTEGDGADVTCSDP